MDAPESKDGGPWAAMRKREGWWFLGVPDERPLGKEGRYPIARSMGGQWKAASSPHWLSMGTADGFRRSLGSFSPAMWDGVSYTSISWSSIRQRIPH